MNIASPSHPGRRIDLWTWLVVLAVLASLLLKLNHLGHSALKLLDESFHAVVAQNLLKHPLETTLVDRAYLPVDNFNWYGSHVWLHKPPMALWQIALSFALFGVNAWALRLPSLLLSTASAAVTYRIGADLLDRPTGAIAAILQAFCPALTLLVQGYLFSDHIDTALLFWSELGIWCLIRAAQSRPPAQRRFAIAAGIAGGSAILSKSYLGLIVLGLAVAMHLFRRLRWWPTLGLRRTELRLVFIATVATITPYLAYAAWNHPQEFSHEYLGMLSHVSGDVDGFAAPWDRLWFEFAANTFYVFYVIALAATTLWIARLAKDRGMLRGFEAIAFLLTWAGVVFAVMTFTVSKLPNATLVAWPAVFLLVGVTISRACRGDAWALGLWLTAMLLTALYPGKFLKPDAIPTGPLIRYQWWILVELAVTLIGCGLIGVAATRLQWVKRSRYLIGLAAILSLWNFVTPGWPTHDSGYAIAAFKTTEANRQAKDLVEIGRFARTLPPNAALILQEHEKFERNTLMFYADRPVYALDPKTHDWASLAHRLAAAGARPYLVIDPPVGAPTLYTPSSGNRVVYAP